MKPLTALASNRLDAFERQWNYDVSYMRAILARGFGALRPMLGLERISAYRKGIPVAPWFAAKIAAARAEDCGPCVQLVVTMAERAGVDARTLRAIVAHDFDAMPDDVGLASASRTRRSRTRPKPTRCATRSSPAGARMP